MCRVCALGYTEPLHTEREISWWCWWVGESAETIRSDCVYTDLYTKLQGEDFFVHKYILYNLYISALRLHQKALLAPAQL